MQALTLSRRNKNHEVDSRSNRLGHQASHRHDVLCCAADDVEPGHVLGSVRDPADELHCACGSPVLYVAIGHVEVHPRCAGNPEIDEIDRTSLLGVFMGMPINLQNLPANMSNGEFQGFVEGWTFQATVSDIKLTMTVSPLAFSLQAFRWNSVPVTELWNTLSNTLTWEQATIVA